MRPDPAPSVVEGRALHLTPYASRFTPHGSRPRGRRASAGLFLVLLVAAVTPVAPEAVWGWIPSSGAGPAVATDPEASLLERVRGNLLKDDLLDRELSYRLLRRTFDVNLLGHLSNGPERLYEVAPSPADPARTWRRLLAENGTPLTAEEQRRRDEKHLREAVNDRRKRERESAAARARRLAKLEQERREQREELDDVFNVYRFDRAGYETHGGERLLVVTMTPRAEAKPATKMGQRMKKFRGRVLVNEQAAQLVRIDVEAAEEVTVGWGFIGRLHKGSRAFYRREPLPDGTWAPVEARFQGAGHTLLLVPFELETWAKYFDYRRLDPETVAAVAAADR